MRTKRQLLRDIEALKEERIRLLDQYNDAREEADRHRGNFKRAAIRITTDRDLRRELRLAQDAHKALAEQLAQVQAANDAMCREAVTAAGTLAPRQVTA